MKIIRLTAIGMVVISGLSGCSAMPSYVSDAPLTAQEGIPLSQIDSDYRLATILTTLITSANDFSSILIQDVQSLLDVNHAIEAFRSDLDHAYQSILETKPADALEKEYSQAKDAIKEALNHLEQFEFNLNQFPDQIDDYSQSYRQDLFVSVQTLGRLAIADT